MCLRTNAVPKSTTRLRNRRRASKAENWLFQRVQRKKNEKSQCNKPRSGSTELNACADAKRRVSRSQMWLTFHSGGCCAAIHERKSIRPPRTNSSIRRTARTRVISGGGQKIKARSSALTRKPPNSATVRKIGGSTQ